MSKRKQKDEDVWDQAQKTLEASASYMAESDALKARLAAYIVERRAAEEQGTVPRGVRRRGERILEEVAALAARPERSVAATQPVDGEVKARSSRKSPRKPRSEKAPSLREDKGHPNQRLGRSRRGRD